jgi:molecular chaperone DnaK
MTEADIPAVGIDLGTTYSVIARLDERGQPITLVNAEGDRLTPSVVLIDGDDVVVGKEAMKAMGTEADRVAQCAKRDMGQRAYHRAIDGKQYPPEVIQAWVLNKLRCDAMQQIGPFDKTVITVPAYFDEVRRKATQDAGYMAGCEVLDIINEPTAAAVAFGFQHGFLGASDGHHVCMVDDRPRRVLVYDLGGGTFDVTVMEIRGSEFLALATDGDVALGGYDWDQRLLDLAADAFQREHGLDLRASPAAAGKLWRECEDAKRTLSTRTKAPVVVEYQGKGHRLEISREQFEEATQNLLDRTRFTCVQALRAAALEWSDLERVLLVGGSTRMPMVRAMLQKLSGKSPDASVAADEAVAHGAALHAGLVLAKRDGRAAKFSICNVNSHSLGVVGVDPQTKRRRNGIVIPRNTPLPVSAKRQFKTAKVGQRSILVQIVEGESPSADDCTPIGRCTVADLPPGLPARSPVDVIFNYQSDGRLKVRVQVQGPGNSGRPGVPGAPDRQLETEIVRENGLSKDLMDAWRQHISGKTPTEYR